MYFRNEYLWDVGPPHCRFFGCDLCRLIGGGNELCEEVFTQGVEWGLAGASPFALVTAVIVCNFRKSCSVSRLCIFVPWAAKTEQASKEWEQGESNAEGRPGRAPLRPPVPTAAFSPQKNGDISCPNIHWYLYITSHPPRESWSSSNGFYLLSFLLKFLQNWVRGQMA